MKNRFEWKIIAPLGWGFQASLPGNNSLILWGLESPLFYDVIIKRSVNPGNIYLCLASTRSVVHRVNAGNYTINLTAGRKENAY